MSDDERKPPSAGFAPIFVRVPVVTAEDLREAEEALDARAAVDQRLRAALRRIKRKIEAAHAEFGEPAAGVTDAKIGSVTPIATSAKRRNNRNTST